MARLLPETLASPAEDAALPAAGRRLVAALASGFDDGWTVIQGYAFRAAGDSGIVDLLLVHRDRGIALLGLGDAALPHEEEHAVETARAMLVEMGFARRFPGSLVIVAVTLRPDEIAAVGQRIERAFADAPRTEIGDSTWADWLVDRLSPRRGLAERAAGLETTGEPAADPPAAATQAPPKSPPRLRGPERDDAWRVAAEMRAPPARAVGPLAADPALASDEAKARTSSWLGMALAACVVGVVLVGMAVLSHGNGPAPHPTPVGTTQ